MEISRQDEMSLDETILKKNGENFISLSSHFHFIEIYNPNPFGDVRTLFPVFKTLAAQNQKPSSRSSFQGNGKFKGTTLSLIIVNSVTNATSSPLPIRRLELRFQQSHL